MSQWVGGDLSLQWGVRLGKVEGLAPSGKGLMGTSEQTRLAGEKAFFREAWGSRVRREDEGQAPAGTEE